MPNSPRPGRSFRRCCADGHLAVVDAGVFAEFGRALIREHQLEGIALAKARGAYAGRKPSLTPGQAEALRACAAAGETNAALAREFGISRQTV